MSLAGKLRSAVVAAASAARAIKADHDTLRRYGEKYGGREGDALDLPRDAVVRIGFQMMVAVRVMHFFRDAGARPGAMVASRLIRHAYGSDIHWDARFEPGVLVVHGMGLAISGKARVGKDVILFQNVTLGESAAPGAREIGAPVVGDGVHLGPGATLLGPIHVGERTKVMAGCVVRSSVPADSVVLAPEPEIASRVAPRSAAGARKGRSGAS